MSNLNRVTIEGRLTRDPETKVVPSGKRVCTFAVAVNFSVKVNDVWENRLSGFFDCTAWEQAAEAAAAFKKGSPVYVEGSLKQESWEKDGEKKSRVVINVREIRMADWAVKAGVKPGAGTAAAPEETFVETGKTPTAAPTVSEDQMPF
jgi:single-strand DNA-binding protein